ncbi:hypothetical protein KSP39_PZI021499 [Platanthera zijinensis]|uniref:Endonuclease/exonuclease/phosphatase domain-containing protein n=1 Tax=Platanthera zijinensis TaxID=2320716 RepID=A0AAP0AZ15_9ASPA
MNMEHLRNCAKAMLFPLRNVSHGLNAASLSGPLHLQDLGVMLNLQESSSHGSNAASWQGPLHLQLDLGVVLNRQKSLHIRRSREVCRKNCDRLRFGCWNIDTLTGKAMKVADIMIRRKINILCLQETGWVSEKAKFLNNSVLNYSTQEKIKKNNGVCIIVKTT